MKTRIYKIVEHSAARVRKTLDREKRFLIFFLEPFSGEIQVCWPLNNTPELSPPAILAVQTCFKRQRSVEIHDAEVDPLTGSMKGADFRSALCVPLFDQVDNPMGVIYLDSKTVGDLDREDRRVIELFSRKISPRIPKWTVPDLAQGHQDPDPTNSRPPTALIALIAACALLILAWVLAPATPGEKRAALERAKPSVKAQKSPQDTLKTFRVLLGLREYGQAWRLLSPELQSKLTEESFSTKVGEWMSVEKNRWDFQHREIPSASIQGNSATVYLEPGKGMEDQETWIFILELSAEKWLIRQAQSGPLGATQ